MSVTDQSRVEYQWESMTATERAFERLSNSELWRKMQMIQSFRAEMKQYSINYDATYCLGRDRWLTRLEEETMKTKPMRKTAL